VSKAERRSETRERILTVARELFAERGYDRTTIRAVAAAARIDPALVMQHYGSKEQLFAACVGSSTAEPKTTDPLEYALAVLSSRIAKEPTASLALLRSMLTHPDASAGLREALAVQQGRLAAGIDTPDRWLRADLIGSIILGVVINRHLLRLDALANAETDHVIDLLRPCLESLTQTPFAPAVLETPPPQSRSPRG
jgi:AcrR family transcriptional regulator